MSTDTSKAHCEQGAGPRLLLNPLASSTPEWSGGNHAKRLASSEHGRREVTGRAVSLASEASTHNPGSRRPPLPDLSMTFKEQLDRCLITRSDGETFVLLWIDSGAAVLYRASHSGDLPAFGIVELGRDIPDKIGAARLYVLAYPDLPPSP